MTLRGLLTRRRDQETPVPRPELTAQQRAMLDELALTHDEVQGELMRDGTCLARCFDYDGEFGSRHLTAAVLVTTEGVPF